MTEAGELFDAFMGDEEGEGGLFESLRGLREGDVNFESNLKDSFSNFKDKLPTSLSSRFDAISRDNGDFILEDSKGDNVNISEVERKFNKGDYTEAFTDMGLKLDTPEERAFVKGLDDGYAMSLKGRMEDTYNAVNEWSKKLGEKTPETSDEFQAICRKRGFDIDSEEKNFKDVKGDAKSPDDPGYLKRVSDWIKEKGGKLVDFIKSNILTLALIAGIIFLAEDLYHYLKNLGNAMSGCFSTTNSKNCKINALTCKQDDLTATNTTICTACTNTKCAGGGDWIPLISAQACTCDPTGSQNYPGEYQYTAGHSYNSCDGKNPGKCPISGPVKVNHKPVRENYGTDSACPFTSGCVSKPEACASTNLMNDDCSAWCDSSVIMTASGQTIGCKQCDFWCATNTALGDIFGLLNPGGILGTIEKWLIIIAVALAVLFILIFVLKEAYHYFFGRKEGGSGKGKDSNININIRADHGDPADYSSE